MQMLTIQHVRSRKLPGRPLGRENDKGIAEIMQSTRCAAMCDTKAHAPGMLPCDLEHHEIDGNLICHAKACADNCVRKHVNIWRWTCQTAQTTQQYQRNISSMNITSCNRVHYSELAKDALLCPVSVSCRPAH
eukprot:6096002-Amphidinium_carterae.1